MNKSGWGKETLRCAALQYANRQVKHCDGLNETSHSFPNVFRVSFIYVKDTISHTAYEKKHSANSRYSDMYIFIHI